MRTLMGLVMVRNLVKKVTEWIGRVLAQCPALAYLDLNGNELSWL